MDTAYEKETGKFVRAWVIGRNTAYIKPEEDTFYANPDEIIDYEEILRKNNLKYIEVRFKKGHTRQYGFEKETFVRPHFFILNKSKYGIQTLPESLEHKKIKNFIYRKFFSEDSDIELYYSKYKRKNETMFNSIKLSELDLDWERFNLKKEDIFEIGITDTHNTRRVDLFLKFNKFHPLFGEGIVIEVQLSPQSERDRKERTLDRALKGYSSIWINKNYFEDYKAEELELTDKKIYINSWHSELYNSIDTISDEMHNRIKKYSREFMQTCDYYIQKIHSSIYPSEGMLCPKCKSGQLVIRKGQYNYFLGCSNYYDEEINCSAKYKIFYTGDE